MAEQISKIQLVGHQYVGDNSTMERQQILTMRIYFFVDWSAGFFLLIVQFCRPVEPALMIGIPVWSGVRVGRPLITWSAGGGGVLEGVIHAPCSPIF